MAATSPAGTGRRRWRPRSSSFTGAGKGRPAGMAIREDEVGRLVERRPDAVVVPTGNGHGHRPGRPCRRRRQGPPPRAAASADRGRRRPGRSPPCSSPLLVSAVSSNPSSSAGHTRRRCRIQPGRHPAVHRGVRRLQPLQGIDPPHLAERVQRPAQHRPRPDGQRLPLRHRGLHRPPGVPLPGRDGRARSWPCAWWPWSPCRWPGSSPSA